MKVETQIKAGAIEQENVAVVNQVAAAGNGSINVLAANIATNLSVIKQTNVLVF